MRYRGKRRPRVRNQEKDRNKVGVICKLDEKGRVKKERIGACIGKREKRGEGV